VSELSTKARAKAASGDLSAARRVLQAEAKALTDLAAKLDSAFTRAVDLLLAVKGRVVVSGMGKSGHVARKIAATLASTGTPAQFVHPAEASHGDLGMIAAGDAVLLFSNSGETRELADLIEHTRRYDVPMVGVAGRAGSTLLQRADVAIVLPDAPEACPMGLAPTTSTTMMMAFGDALAVALMTRRGFSPDDYRVLHPGGSLGKQLLRVADKMHIGEDVPLVREATPMSEVLVTMTAKRFGCAGVLDTQGRLIGIVTDGDLRRHMNEKMLRQSAAEVMTKRPRTIRAGALLPEALHHMTGKKPFVTCLFVIDDAAAGNEPAKPVGIIHVHDCLQAGYS
jgi:arabinose-5-phosphate isomerase